MQTNTKQPIYTIIEMRNEDEIFFKFWLDSRGVINETATTYGCCAVSRCTLKRFDEAANRFLFRMWFSVLFILSIVFGYAMRHVIMCQCDAVCWHTWLSNVYGRNDDISMLARTLCSRFQWSLVSLMCAVHAFAKLNKHTIALCVWWDSAYDSFHNTRATCHANGKQPARVRSMLDITKRKKNFLSFFHRKKEMPLDWASVWMRERC